MGGYLRDLIQGGTPKDLDVCFATSPKRIVDMGTTADSMNLYYSFAPSGIARKTLEDVPSINTKGYITDFIQFGHTRDESKLHLESNPRGTQLCQSVGTEVEAKLFEYIPLGWSKQLEDWNTHKTGKRPVAPVGFEKGSSWADFTCNELLYSWKLNVLIDPSGHGIQDAQEKKLSCTVVDSLKTDWNHFPHKNSRSSRVTKFEERGYTCDDTIPEERTKSKGGRLTRRPMKLSHW